jgi:hypothetical protein
MENGVVIAITFIFRQTTKKWGMYPTEGECKLPISPPVIILLMPD